MDLSNLKPAKGSINKNSKRVGRGQGSGKGGTATREVTKELNLDLVTPKKLVLKVVKCHFKEEFQNLDLKILTG